MEDLSGRAFGAYRIVGPLGAGGMASVYQAYQPAVDRHVALKILPRHFAQDPEFLARFRQEAKVLARLQHPHILPVHDFGESDGYTYIVMPFIETGTLAAALTDGPLEIDMIKRVVTQVGDALDCAHGQGLVHRDVKPSNILMDERGNCLLADFGIAKILEGADTLTATGGLLGTPNYMSPEQGQGLGVDGRSDIYSLGVVLYEMATGQVPYHAETPVAVMVKHIHDPLPVPSRVNPQIPEALQRMIFRSMHKDPAERFPTASAMVEAMSQLTAADMTPMSALASAETLAVACVPPLPTPPSASPPPDDATQTAGGSADAGAAPALVAAPEAPPVAAAEPDAGTADPDEAADTTTEPSAPPVPVAPATISADSAPSSRPASDRPPDATSATPPPAQVDRAIDAPDTALLAALERAEADRVRLDADAAARDPFPDQGDGTFLDRRVGARWTAVSEPRPGSDGLLWADANDYCDGLALARSADWRLPTQRELDAVLQRIDPERYPWGLTLWSADRPAGDPNRLWVTNSPLYAPSWSTAMRDASGRRLTHRAVCVSVGTN